jgi:HAD superfamily hydrolase (TIGR01490 family)
MSAAAVFDLDGTLLQGTSAERLLVPFLVRRGVVRWRSLMAALARVATLPLAGPTRALRRNKLWLAGAGEEDVICAMPEFLEAELAPRWRASALAEIHRFRRAGIPIALLSGAPDFVADVVSRHLGMDAAVGTPMEVQDGRFTGRLSGPHTFGEGKREAVTQLAGRLGFDPTVSFGFADHGSDVPFLECFGHPVAVSPDARLRRVARSRGWEVLATGSATRPLAADPHAE